MLCYDICNEYSFFEGLPDDIKQTSVALMSKTVAEIVRNYLTFSSRTRFFIFKGPSTFDFRIFQRHLAVKIGTPSPSPLTAFYQTSLRSA